MTSKVYIETYGCQMNVADSEVVASLLSGAGFSYTENIEEAQLILINTCSVRENAEQRIRRRIKTLGHLKRKKINLKIGIIGCMAERLKDNLFEDDQIVDIIAGPDAYRHLPALISEAEKGHRVADILLSQEETYRDILPVRTDSNGVSSFVSITRGCNNMCSYCIVPYVRGIERSRDPGSILSEVHDLFEKGYREVTLLGQNVNSYRWTGNNSIIHFPDLLKRVAEVDPLLRVRFSTSHPKDISDHLLHTIAGHPNICKHIHLPAQSGSNRILKMMKRQYTREWYMERIDAIRGIIPGCSLSTDMITGFCTESDEDHEESLSLMRQAEFDFAYMFKYSVRPGTKAAERYRDDVPEAIKKKRLSEMISLQNTLSERSKRSDIGKIYEVLIEGYSKRSDKELSGRNSQNKVVVFPAAGHKHGEYVRVVIERCTSATLIGKVV